MDRNIATSNIYDAENVCTFNLHDKLLKLLLERYIIYPDIHVSGLATIQVFSEYYSHVYNLYNIRRESRYTQ